MSGDFPDDWFRPVDQVPPDGEEPQAQVSDLDEDGGSDPTDPGSSGSSATDPGSVSSSATTVPNSAQTNPSGISTSGIGGAVSTGAQDVTSSGVDVVPRVDQPRPPARGVSETGDLDSGPPSGPEPGVIPVIAAPGALVVGRVEGREAEAPPGSTLHPGVVVLVVVILSLAVGLVIGLLLLGSGPAEPEPSLTPASPTVAAPSARQPYTGVISPVAATKVTASCTADDRPDSQGNRVSYDPENLIDKDATTAWRCNGDGVGRSLSFTFAPGTKLVGVGVLNGYAKTSGTDRYYDQFRRVLAVRWEMPDGTYFIQYLSDNNLSVQRVMFPITVVDGAVTMTIQESSPPGVPNRAERDAVLISTVEFWTVPS